MSMKEIGENINKDRTSVFYILRTYNSYKDDIYFKLILECYQNKDKSLLQKSNEFLEAKIKEINDYNASIVKIKRLSKPNVVTISKNKTDEIKSKNKKPHILEVAKNLRKKRSYLNDKVYTKWTIEDFEEYEKVKQA